MPFEDEATELLPALWREPVDRYYGRLHHFDDVRLPPRSPDGAPPLWVRGDTPGSEVLVGEGERPPDTRSTGHGS